MALDGILLNKIVTAMQDYIPAKINKIYPVSNTEILFQLRSQGKKQNLLISCHSLYNRLNITNRSYPTPEDPGHFIMLLRKHLEGGIITELVQSGLDRYCIMNVHLRNEIGDKVFRKVYIELMGKYANVILVDENNKILDALKRIPPFENSRRTILSGAEFKTAEAQDGKKNPFECNEIEENIPLHQQFEGFSPLLSKEVEYRMKHGQTFAEIIKEIKDSKKIYLCNVNQEVQYHCIPLLQFETSYKEYDIHEGLDILYYHKEEKDRIKQQTGDLFKFVRKQLKHNRNKIIKLNDALDEALDCEKWREYGDLLYAYSFKVEKGMNEIACPSFDGDKEIVIPLDPKLDGKQNAKKCFQKYNKGKKGQEYIREQIDLCQKEIIYFEAIEQQLELADFTDAKEIREELVSNGYMKPQYSKIRRKKKPDAIKVNSFTLDNGLTVIWGKNNLQNDQVTFKLSSKQDTWFHAKDYHGSHVVVSGSDLDEATIRFAANLAALYSKGRLSSSVPVNYCPIRNLKRVPGAKNGFVTMSTYKTIYIDPDESILDFVEEKMEIKK